MGNSLLWFLGFVVSFISLPLKNLLPGSKCPGRTALKLACGYRRFCTSQARALNGVEGERCYPATWRCILDS